MRMTVEAYYRRACISKKRFPNKMHVILFGLGRRYYPKLLNMNSCVHEQFFTYQ